MTKQTPESGKTAEAYSGWNSTSSVIGTIMLFFAPTLLAAVILVAFGYIGSDQADSFSDLTQEQVFTLYGLGEAISIGCLGLMAYALKIKAKDLGITKDNIQKIWYAIPAFVIYLIAATIIASIFGLFVSEEVLNQEQELGFEKGGTNREMVMAFIALVILAPVSEELVYRGFLFNGLKKSFDFRIAMVISAVMFGLAHGQLNVGIDTFVLGMFLSWLLHETGNILIPILLHAIKNFIAFYFLFINPDALDRLSGMIQSLL